MVFFLIAAFASQALAEDRLRTINLSAGLKSCLAPIETYPYRLDKSDPLYETAREDHQRHLDEMEDYVNCLDRERGAALDQLRASFDLFLENFGEDAVLDYAAERGVDGE
ncbi:MAG: hypothetical protein OXR62_02485 [Ahrensia sp.]|nr:hypothetical protein [Ahrensia sp.]